MITTKRIQTFVNISLRRILGIWRPEIISNERLWQSTLHTQALTWNPEGKRKEDDLDTFGVVIWKQTSKKLVRPGDSWRDWLKTSVPGVVMLEAYAPEGAMKALN